jgi:hypothetical protein
MAFRREALELHVVRQAHRSRESEVEASALKEKSRSTSAKLPRLSAESSLACMNPPRGVKGKWFDGEKGRDARMYPAS